MGLFLVSSLEAIGEGKALIGGMVVQGNIYLGDSVSVSEGPGFDKVIEIRFYGNLVDRVEQGLSAGLVVTLDWACNLRLYSEIHCDHLDQE